MVPTLKPNDTVALICPSCKCWDDKHPELTKSYLADNFDLKAIYKEDCLTGTSPKRRAEILLDFLKDDQIKLITSIRGGDGSADIIPYLHQHKELIMKLTPKPLLGLSDFTALLLYFEKQYKWPVIHGSSPLHFALNQVDQKTQHATMNYLLGKSQLPAIKLNTLNTFAKRNPTIKACVTGGCLSLVNISIQDIWEIDTRNKIVFFEDIGEKAHQIIRTLKYLSRLGKFDQAQAIILGDFNCKPLGCTAEEQEKNKFMVENTLQSFSKHHNLPVFKTDSFGHGKTNIPLLYNIQYLISDNQLKV